MAAVPRFFCSEPLLSGTTINLSAGATRHVQVLRLQPGDSIILFGGYVSDERANQPATHSETQGEFQATVVEIGRRDVRVLIGRHDLVNRESPRELHLAIGMPANDRMDWLVEKATELGVAVIHPLMTERSVVRLDQERARKKTAHWNSIAISACEQCGRNTVPDVRDVSTFASWSRQLGDTPVGAEATRIILTFRQGALPLQELIAGQLVGGGPITVLSGPEGGLSAAEEDLALQQGFRPATLGPRILRAETAALAALTLLV